MSTIHREVDPDFDRWISAELSLRQEPDDEEEDEEEEDDEDGDETDDGYSE